jgi:hypothetical protein
MTVAAFVGVAGSRGCTTVCAAAALTWPNEVVLAELDPSGGDVGAWFDLPEEPALKSAVASAPAGEWPVVVEHARAVTPTLRVLAAPIRSREAAVVVNEASSRLIPVLSALEGTDVLADAGRATGGLGPVAAQAALVVIVASQVPGSPRATAATLDRAAGLVDVCAHRAMPVVVALIGDDPYPIHEISDYLGVPCQHIADDPLGAAVIAGRPATGRLASRSRLLRSAGDLAVRVHTELTAQRQLGAAR